MSLRKTMVLCVFAMTASLLPAQTPASSGSTATGAQQVATSGTKVHGTITDPDGELIPGATVTFTPAKGNAVKTTSGSDGTYTLNVTPGSYTMLVSMPGFSSYVMTNLKVPAVASTTLDAKMKLGEETTVINVEANALTLSTDPDSNASSTIITGKDLDALSDDPDELSSELSALAGPAAGPSGGQIYVDGFTGGQLPPKSSIREIRINQNPFSAQYDRVGYGRIEILTKPGTDKLHGSFQINGNPSQFNSTNPLSNATQPPYHTLFMFGSITGPLGKSASYNLGGSHRDIEDNTLTNTQVYATAANPSVPCPPGPNQDPSCATRAYQRFTNVPQVRTDINPRLDLALGEKNVLTTRFQYVQNDSLNGGVGNLSLPDVATNSASRSVTLQVSDTQTWSSSLINETRFEYERETTAATPFATTPQVSVSGLFTYGGSPSQNTSDVQNHFELQNYTSVALKKHFIRLGGRFRSTSESQNPASGTNGSFVYATLAAYQASQPNVFTYTKVNNPNISYVFADLGMYAEDDWKLKPNLTVSYGLRYETQNHIGNHHDFAPRISFAYGVGAKKGAPVVVIRGGYGMFYDRFGNSYILNLERNNGRTVTQYNLSGNGIPTGCSPSNINACISGTGATALSVSSRTTNLRTPYNTQFAIGIDKSISKYGTLSVNYIHTLGLHALATQNINYPTNGQIPSAVSPKNTQYFSEGAYHQNQLILSGNLRTTKWLSFGGFYAMGFAAGNTNGAGATITVPYNIQADYGRTTFDTRNRGTVIGTVTLPHYILISPYIQAQSGSPFNVVIGQDLNNDGFSNERPLLANGATPSGTNIKTLPGCGTFAVPGAAGVPAGSQLAPINYCTGPAQFTFNMRLTKSFGFGGSRNGDNQRQGGRGGRNGGQGGQGGFGGGGGGQHGGGGGPRGGGPGGGFGGGGGLNTGKRYNVNFGVNVQNLFNNTDRSAPNATLISPIFGTTTQLSGFPYTSNAAVRRISLQASFSF